MGILYSEPMCQAAYDNDAHEVYRLFKDTPKSLNVQEPRSGDTPLIAGIRRGNHHVVKYLLSLDADVSVTNKKQRTCLHYAAKRTYSFLDYLMIAILMPILLIGYLIMKGNTALHYACVRKSQGMVPLLLEKQADISIKNMKGETPLDIARRLKFTKIVAMLKKSE
ncbi:ankyrin repeat domain-containing protein 22 isoform X2 [Engraulis encrasicolus]|uniref:ankyrin repeat domain-containing protein 22 isoform X2 n=1 Tax=Engraulis encrasicolus TaxID=184585 RepID=UPI002FD576E6